MAKNETPCGACGGSGWLLETTIDKDAGQIDSREIACRACSGTGYR